MSNALFDKGREGFLDGTIDADTAVLKCKLIDLAAAGPATGAWKITNVSSGANPTITTQANHGLSTGDLVAISGVGGATGVNGNFAVASTPTGTTFTITTGAPGTYTSGGYLMNLSKTFMDTIGASGQVSTSAALASVTKTNGILDGADSVFTAVSNAGAPVQGVLLYQASAVTGGADVAASAQRCIAWIDTATGLPVTPNGGDITVAWDNGTNKIFKL